MKDRTTNGKTRIGHDLDGVWYPFTDEIKVWAERRLGHKLPEFVHWNSHQKHWGISHEQLQMLMAEALVAGKLWSEYSPLGLSDFKRTVGRFKEMGFHVVIATDRLQGTDLADLAQLVTVEWLEKWGIEYDEIMFTSDKRDANCAYFIEDRPQAVPLLRLDGTNAVYMDRPWNKWFPGPRVYSGSEYVDYVMEQEYGY